ncbi:MAG: hypothetical protein CV090_04075 [Nitrospira sp. WS238]|nr:hypothetical protein [Nitrospira sp. WS238]
MAGESGLADTLAELLTELNRRNVPYALAGGWAFSALVEPRATTDIDLLVLLDSPSQAAIQLLVSTVFTSTIVHPSPMKVKGISIWRCMGLRGQQEVVVDFLLADSAFLQSALSRRRQILLWDQMVAILTLEDLILMKMIAGRLQDQADLEKIATAELQVDSAYIEVWKNKLGLVSGSRR